tara:strand:- start:92 stop:646 length:555 start_codon:yes stop_codon:yes gene_type:complete
MIIDLFSGSGSATGIWETYGFMVERYDIITSPKVPTIPIDLSNTDQVKSLGNIRSGHHVHLLWASPPCTEYSDENRFFCKNPHLIDTTLWRNTLYLIDKIKPDHWVIENVRGAKKIWGKPTQRFGSYWLWGNFPKFNLPGKVQNKNVHVYKNKKERAKKTAQIPFELSYGLFKSIAFQKKLFTP